MSRFLSHLQTEIAESAESFCLWRRSVLETLVERNLTAPVPLDWKSHRFIPFWRFVLDRELIEAAAILNIHIETVADTVEGEIARRYIEGETLTQLAERFEISTGRVKAMLDAAGVETRAQGSRTGEPKLHRMAALREDGMTYREIGELVGLSKQAVCHALQRMVARKKADQPK